MTSCKKKYSDAVVKTNKEEIIEKYLKNGAWNHHYLDQEWDEWINKGINEDSTIAYLWQQKALPLWKQQKYELAKTYYNKAVALDRKQWLSRFAYLKCIFANDYSEALSDFNAYKKEYGTIFEQDHLLEFYIGLCHLQLNQYDEAINVLEENIIILETQYGVDWVHYLDRFYLAIAHYENKNYSNAIVELNKVLEEYPKFSDAQFYKGLCLAYLGKKDQAIPLMEEGKSNYGSGYTFNEDSNLYEKFPYQVTWQWNNAKSILPNS